MFLPYDDFLAALRMRESTGNYQAVNAYNYLGAYQFGEAALIDLGFVNHDGNAYDNNYSGGFTGTYGVTSVTGFLNSTTAQDAAADDWFELMWGYLANLGLDAYLGQTVAGITLTASGLLGGAHLLGQGAVRDFVLSGGADVQADAFGTTISHYIDLFGGYRMPFDTGETYIDPQSINRNIAGSSGDDTLTGGAGDDTLSGGAGHDDLSGDLGDDVLSGDAGDDNLNGGAGNDWIFAGANNDTLLGGAGADHLFGGIGQDLLQGGAGNDVLTGEWGNDVLSGEAGNDVLHGNQYEDWLFGGAGEDTLYGDEGFDNLFGGIGNDILYGGENRDTLVGEWGDDVLSGENGNDVLHGNQNNDWIFGGAGEDMLFGGSGRDHLFGSLGNDRLDGGAGNDVLTGEQGSDVFVFADGFGADIITDFDATNAAEVIDLSAVSTIDDYADLASHHMQQSGNDVQIDAGGGNTIVLSDVTLGDLDSSDFIF